MNDECTQVNGGNFFVLSTLFVKIIGANRKLDKIQGRCSDALLEIYQNVSLLCSFSGFSNFPRFVNTQCLPLSLTWSVAT